MWIATNMSLGGDVHFKPDCMGNLGMFLSKQQHRGSDWSSSSHRGVFGIGTLLSRTKHGSHRRLE